MTETPSRDYVSHPGATLAEILQEREMSQAQLAKQMGRPAKTINEIIRGKAQIVPATALQLERALGLPASFWMRREAAYREFLERDAETKRLLKSRSDFRGLPIAAMEKLAWISHQRSTADKYREVLKFMRVGSPERLRDVEIAAGVGFRKGATTRSRPLLIAAWLRRGEQLAERALTAVKRPDVEAFRAALPSLRTATRLPVVKMVELLRARCAEHGVVLLVVRQLPRSSVSGATRWLRGHPVIQLSLRFRQAEQLAFSFFHEAAHVVLHSHDLFVDEAAHDSSSIQCESEADEFARDLLIDPANLQKFLREHPRPTDSDIIRFAEQVQVGEGIVVGRLQHDKALKYADHSRYLLSSLSDNDMLVLEKQTIDWVRAEP